MINGYKQFIKYRSQSKTYKNDQEHDNGHINHRQYHSEVKYIISKMKNTVERVNNRFHGVEN